MSGAINNCALFLGLSPPQHKNDGRRTLIHRRYHGVGKALPAVTLMRTSDAMLNRQYAVQQQHTLLSPLGKVTVGWHGDADVILEFTKYVLQRGRDALTTLH